MMKFDLKAFREKREFKQSVFAEMIGYDQSVISRMEKGEKPVSDKLLLKIEEVFEINLDDHKRFDRNKKGLYLKEDGNGITTSEDPHKEHAELRRQYTQLQEEKSVLDTKYFTLSEEHRKTTLELAVLVENNILLKKIAADTQELLNRMSPVGKI